ncbi:DUF1048 domain-containing protein [Microbacterium sp. Mu-80]|uniref:DUF1048 domain-containing protein n=1 Tax=Microbacterium bandirmense TaxID=3122050 RepID=A0ABU8LAU3_9MICO
MAAKWIEMLTGPLEQKKQYKHDKARMEALPEPYVTSAKAMHRYLMYAGGITDGDTLMRMFTDMVDLWEQASIDRTAVREIVGADPVDFAETFAKAYAGREWLDKERARFTRAIDAAEHGEEQGS